MRGVGKHVDPKRGVCVLENASRPRATTPSLLMGGCALTGAAVKGTSEPVRSLRDALKPKLHYAYDRCADAYLRAYVE